jgi:CubicO group peptidase (beta-lactamase class C family)
MTHVARAVVVRQPSHGFTHLAQSHHNYGLAALVVSRVTGLGLGDCLKKRVFQPLGMEDTGGNNAAARGC